MNQGGAPVQITLGAGGADDVKAGRGHVATVRSTPDQSGFNTLEVYATTQDGLELMPYDYYFSVS